jgi:hypothetical protein
MPSKLKREKIIAVTRSPLRIIKEGKMKKVIYGSLVLVFLVAQFGIAAQSRTTEFHKLKEKITSDKVMNITLPDGYFLSGIVKDTAGTPLNKASVFALSSDGYLGWGGGETDAKGKFSFPLQAGNYTVGAGPHKNFPVDPSKFSRLLPATVENVAVANDTGMGEIKLLNGYILSGKVDPPPGTGALSLFSSLLQIFPSGSQLPSAIAQQGGNIPIINKYAVALPAGTYTLLVWASGMTSTPQYIPMTYKSAKVKVSKDTVKNFVMPRGGYRIWGTVKDTGNVGLDGVLYFIPKSGPFNKWFVQMNFSLQGSFGNILYCYLAPGNYTVMFVPYMYIEAGYKGKATVSYYDLTMSAADKMLNLVAKNGVVLSGKITDAKKRAVKSGAVFALKSGMIYSNLSDWDLMIASPDSKGQYRLPLPPDTYNIYAVPHMQETALTPTEILRQNLIKTMSTLRRLHLQ